MAYVITEPCIGTKDTACVDVCPVDCIHPRKDEPAFESAKMLNIHPDECIDCGACVPACPVEAIFALDEVPDKFKDYIEQNRRISRNRAGVPAGTRQAPRALASRHLPRLRPRSVGAAPRSHAADAERSGSRRAARPERARLARRGRRRSISRVSRLLNLHVAATQTLHKATDTFLGTRPAPIAVRHRHCRQRRGGEEHVRAHSARAAGALAGASARRSRHDRRLPAARTACSRRGACCERKGFPESYDVRRLIAVHVATSKSGAGAVHAPVYSHQAYDIVPGRVPGRRSSGHRPRRGAERAAGRRRQAGRSGAGVRVGLLRFLDLHRRRRTRHRALVRRAVSDAARDRVPRSRIRTSTAMRR